MSELVYSLVEQRFFWHMGLSAWGGNASAHAACRELLDVAGGSENSSEQDFMDLLGAVPSGSPWDALPMALDDAVLAKAAQEAAADLAAESRPPAGACGKPAAAPAAEEPHDAFDWLLPFIDSPSTDEVRLLGACCHVSTSCI